MTIPSRRKDWFLILSLLCFAAAPLISIGMIVFLETPAANELQAEYVPHRGNPAGHFFTVGLMRIVRTFVTFGVIVLGLAGALIGSIRIPRNAEGSIRLRDTALGTGGITGRVRDFPGCSPLGVSGKNSYMSVLTFSGPSASSPPTDLQPVQKSAVSHPQILSFVLGGCRAGQYTSGNENPHPHPATCSFLPHGLRPEAQQLRP